MRNKSIFTEEELMPLSKDFLIATILQLEKNKNYWLDKYMDSLEQNRKEIKDMLDIFNKK